MRRFAIFAVLFAVLGGGAWFAYQELIAPRLPEGPAGKGGRAQPAPWRQVETKGPVPEPDLVPVPVPEAEAEAAPDAIVLGRVLNAKLAPLAGVEVEVLVSGLEAARFRTDAEGSFRIPTIPGDKETFLAIHAPGLPESSPYAVETRRARAVRLNWMVGLEEKGAIRPESVLSQECGDALRIALRGATDLPDGTILVLTLVYGEKTHARQEIPCAGGRLDAEIRPEDRGYFSGAYRIEITFDPRLQSQGVSERLPAERREIEIVDVPVYVGDPESAARYDQDLARYYGDAVREIWPLVVALELAADLSVGAVKDPAERDDKLLRLRAHAGADLLPGGRLDTKAWRAWIDEKVRPAIDAMEEPHRNRPRPKYPEVENRLGLLFQDVRLLSRIASVRAYRASGRIEDPADAYFSEVEPDGEQTMALNRIRKTRQFVDRWLRERRAASTPTPPKA